MNPEEQTMMRAVVTEQIVIELAREAVDAHVLGKGSNLPRMLWAAIEADTELKVTDVALAAIDLFGHLIEEIGHRYGIDAAAGILETTRTDHQGFIVELAQRLEGNTR